MDPFSNWLVSSVSWELPLTESQQALVVSLLGAYVVFTAVCVVLLLLVGVGSACEDVFALLRGECCLCWARFRNSSPGTWVLIDEDTDVQAVAEASEAGVASRAPPSRSKLNASMMHEDAWAHEIITHSAYEESLALNGERRGEKRGERCGERES